MPFMINDPTWILIIPAMIFALWAQFKVKSTFNKYGKISSSRRITGAQVAKYLLSQNGISQVEVTRVAGSLTDHYDPRNLKLALSEDVFDSTSLAAIGVAAHETGHAIQHHQGYLPIRLRNSVVPVVNIGSFMAMPLFILGLFMASPKLMDIGILLFLGVILFHALTLPVELNASIRAIRILSEGHYLVGDEITGAKKVLQAAAMTYIAAAAMAVMQLIRLLILRGNRD
ncbi:MAG: zinc metallopeptidase [Candidatus Delongbacteria bacterium]|nr:zinc metallopeptidase [Candidatus Delongbacteria bacterium]